MEYKRPIYNSQKEFIDCRIEKLKSLKNDFSEEIPDEIIHSTYNDPKYGNRFKCRQTWFATISLVTYLLENHSEYKIKLPKEISQNSFDKIIKNLGKITTRKDINSANNFLDKLIVYLEANSSKNIFCRIV